ncbi:MAG: hypothetical protein R2762_01325 [Bryobacteraceae bacterium]
MDLIILVNGLLLAAGLVVCLGLFVQLKRELHQLRKAVGRPNATQRGKPAAIRIPIDPLPLPRGSRERMGREAGEGTRTEDAQREPIDTRERISQDEIHLRARLEELTGGRAHGLPGALGGADM